MDECGGCINSTIEGAYGYIDNCGFCDSDSSNDDTTCGQDCAGVWGGTAEIDTCGICSEGSTGKVFDSDIDCNGVCFGSWTLDDCGVCDDDMSNNNSTCSQDCNGEWDGTAVEDVCGECGGSGPADNFDCDGNCIVEVDCLGVCGGLTVVDECGVCGGGGPLGECGCDDIPEGFCDCQGTEFDNCGVCGGDNTTCSEDCAGVWGGSTVEDCAGTCGGLLKQDCAGDCNGSAVEDCLGECGGDAVVDDCGTCAGDGRFDDCGYCDDDLNNDNTTCEQDCAGAWGGNAQEDCAGNCGGSAAVDACGVCDDIPLNNNTTCSLQDCAGVFGGEAEIDDCGQCVENGSINTVLWNQSCADCAGDPNGEATTDCFGVCSNTEGWIGFQGDNGLDECGVCGGSGLFDECGICDEDELNNCIQDCAGVWGGDAVYDICVNDNFPNGVCGGNGWDQCDDDENGIVNEVQYKFGAYNLSMSDIPKDQGGYVYLSFTRSILDTDTIYSGDQDSSSTDLFDGAEGYLVQRKDSGVWTSVQSIFAYGASEYQIEVRTFSDSTSVDTAVNEYRVIAAMDEGNFESDASIFGYSVDNIAPSIPNSVFGWYDSDFDVTEVTWNAVMDNDISHYNLYKDDEFYASTFNTFFEDVENDDPRGYSVSSVDIHENESERSEVLFISESNVIGLDGLPDEFALLGAYPNPFNPQTTISIAVPEYSKVNLQVYNIKGQLVEVVKSENMLPGVHSIKWEPVDLSSGVYFVMMRVNQEVFKQKIMYIK